MFRPLQSYLHIWNLNEQTDVNTDLFDRIQNTVCYFTGDFCTRQSQVGQVLLLRGAVVVCLSTRIRELYAICVHTHICMYVGHVYIGLVTERDRAQVRDVQRWPAGKLQDKYAYFCTHAYVTYAKIVCVVRVRPTTTEHDYAEGRRDYNIIRSGVLGSPETISRGGRTIRV